MEKTKGEKMTNRINSISFRGNMANAYIQKKIAQQARTAAETTKEAARAIINKNKNAAKKHEYIPADAYFGPVSLSERKIGQEASINSAAMTRKSISSPVKKTSEKVEPDFNYFG